MDPWNVKEPDAETDGTDPERLPAVVEKSKHPVDQAWEDLFLPEEKRTTQGDKALYEDDRSKTLLWMRSLDNTMRMGPGRRLSQFKLTSPKINQLKRHLLAHTLTLQILVTLLPFLCLWTDRESSQHAAWCYLAYVRKVRPVAKRPWGKPYQPPCVCAL